MKLRTTIAALATGALALGLIAPAASVAAPSPDRHRKPPAVLPDGEAMLNLQSAEARVAKIGRHDYRVTLPRKVVIAWLGQVSGTTTVGAFTPGAVVDNWARMGYVADKGTLAGLSWGKDPGSRHRHRVAALVSDPQISRGGELSFRLRPLYGKLPRELTGVDMSIVNREPPLASPVVAATPDTGILTFPTFPIDTAQTAFAQVTVTNNASAVFTFTAAAGYTSPCTSPVNLDSTHMTTGFPAVTCGNGTVNGQWLFKVKNGRHKGGSGWVNSQIVFGPAESSGSDVGEAWLDAGYTPPGSGEFHVFLPLGLWGSGLIPYVS